MKKILIFTLILFSLCSAGCNKRNSSQCIESGGYSGPIQVIKDCTGTYIRYLEKDYRVCNEDVLKYHNNGSRATLTFFKVDSCSELPLYICNMYHQNEGLVTVSCIR
ncbi:MAG: hypothetical protein WC716_13685 [Chitinophagaceae bacterium]|jgi:hypothetical protein